MGPDRRSHVRVLQENHGVIRTVSAPPAGTPADHATRQPTVLTAPPIAIDSALRRLNGALAQSALGQIVVPEDARSHGPPRTPVRSDTTQSLLRRTRPQALDLPGRKRERKVSLRPDIRHRRRTEAADGHRKVRVATAQLGDGVKQGITLQRLRACRSQRRTISNVATYSTPSESRRMPTSASLRICTGLRSDGISISPTLTPDGETIHQRPPCALPPSR